MQSSFQTLQWREGALELLDQRALPHTCTYVRCCTSGEVAAAIRDMVVRGAPAIGCAAAYGVALEAACFAQSTRRHFDEAIAHAMAALATSRPTAVNLFWALTRMKHVLAASPEADAAALSAELLDEAHAMCREDVESNRAMGAHGAALLPQRSRVLTHCNAGALATAGHGTALGVIRSAIQAGKRVHVYADETRPYLQGARLTAWELKQDDVPVTLIADNAAGFLMSRGNIDAVIVGADRVAANGDIANKIGTYQVAVLAQRHGIPFYVACPLSTIDVETASGADIPIEERAGAEVMGYGEARWAPLGIDVFNPVFDVTPAELVTALITEKGVMCHPTREKIIKLMSKR